MGIPAQAGPFKIWSVLTISPLRNECIDVARPIAKGVALPPIELVAARKEQSGRCLQVIERELGFVPGGD